jgi:hypothetical protein
MCRRIRWRWRASLVLRARCQRCSAFIRSLNRLLSWQRRDPLRRLHCGEQNNVNPTMLNTYHLCSHPTTHGESFQNLCSHSRLSSTRTNNSSSFSLLNQDTNESPLQTTINATEPSTTSTKARSLLFVEDEHITRRYDWLMEIIHDHLDDSAERWRSSCKGKGS